MEDSAVPMEHTAVPMGPRAGLDISERGSLTLLEIAPRTPVTITTEFSRLRVAFKTNGNFDPSL
jgi:hypothetical protein